MRPFRDPAVARVFEAYPARVRRKLLALRELIFATAAATEGVGELEETLKWGEPAYVTAQTKSGSAVRIDWRKARPNEYAMYFHCQTNLVDTFRAMFPDEFVLEGNRALVFQLEAQVPKETLAFCVAASLTYHRNKRRASRR